MADNHNVATTTVAPVADLSVSQVDQPDPVHAGHPLTYTLTVHNGGPSSSASVTLTDNLDPQVTLVSAAPSIDCTQNSPVVCTLPGLPSGGDSQVQVVVNTTVDGLLTNSVTVASSTHDNDLTNNTSHEDTVVATTADLSVTQQDTPDPVIAEQQLTYNLTVHNAGPSIAGSVRLTDTLPGGVTPLSATPDHGSCSLGSVTTCDLGNLASGSDFHVQVVVIPLVEGTISNQVEVATGTYEPNLGDNSDLETTTVLPLSADLKLTLTGSSNPVAAGAYLTYTAQVTNLGPSRAISPALTFALANEITYVTPTPSCAQQGQTVTCSMDEIPAHGSTDVTLVVQVSSSTFVSRVTSTASVTSAVADPSTGNNHASVTTNLYRSADLDIDLLARPNPVGPGTILTYTLVYTNHGPSDAIYLVLTDTLPADVIYNDKNSSSVCDAVIGTPFVTCKPHDLVAGHSAQIVLVVSVNEDVLHPLINTVEISSQTSDPNKNNNTSVVSTGIDPEDPLLQWIAPEVDDTIPYMVVMRPGLEITLVVTATDNIQIDYVRFTRWDHVRNEWVEIGIGHEVAPGVYQYVWVLDSYLELPNGNNAIYAYAYDTAGNWTRKRIWILPNNPVLLPTVMK